MMKTPILLSALLLALPLCAFTGEFRDKGSVIAVDFPSGWAHGKSDDPAVTLKLEKGRFFFEFARQDSELGDYYLKARVKEQVDSLRSKGNRLSGDIRQISMHGAANAYYTAYESMGTESFIAFLTYNGASYAVSGSGMGEGEFRNAIFSVRRPGERIESPKPRKVKFRRQRKEEAEDADFGTQIFKDGDEDVPVSTGSSVDLILNAFVVSTAAAPASPIVKVPAPPAPPGFFFGLGAKTGSGGLPPYLPRKPLPAAFWGILLVLWVAGSFKARSIAGAYQNPKLPPPPADVPPDFFFPFLISKADSAAGVTYNVLSRQRQLLLAEYPYEHELYLAGSAYGCLFFHVVWSLLAFVGRGEIMVNALLGLPFGRAFASLPEFFFIAPFLAGVFIYYSRKPSLQLYDAQSTLVMQVKPEIVYGLIRDGEGKEVARLVRKGGFKDRSWEFVDTDNMVVFTIREDFPKGRLLRMLFGNLGGALRSHYGIFAQDRRAGFIFLDPSSSNRLQLHIDFSFARLGHPAQILAAVLYVISREKDPVYPSPF